MQLAKLAVFFRSKHRITTWTGPSLSTGTIFYVGTEAEVGHHADPLTRRLTVRIAEPETVVRDAVAGDVALFYSEHFERFRNAIRSLHKRRVATLYAIDGILEWRNAWDNRDDEPACPWTMRPVLCDKVACIGASQARTLRQWGNTDKVEVVGIPRFDHLVRASITSSESDTPFRLLVMTAKWPGFTEHQRRLITQSLIDLKDWVSNHKTVCGRHIELIWRLTGGLDRVVGIKNELRDTTGEDLASALRRADATITTPSTTQLESMLLGKPTAILDYTNSPLYVDAAWRVTAVSQLESTMEQLCEPPAERMHYQDCVLADALQCEENATNRMTRLIESMREIAAVGAAQNRPLVFPQNLLLTPHGSETGNTGAELDAAEIFRERAECELDDLARLRGELADAKREVKLLRATVGQLNAELGQAHAIFDTIHQHPIAGPVVRTRERILAWAGKVKSTKGESN